MLAGENVLLSDEPFVLPLDRVQSDILLPLLLPELAECGGRLCFELSERLPQEGDRGDRTVILVVEKFQNFPHG